MCRRGVCPGIRVDITVLIWINVVFMEIPQARSVGTKKIITTISTSF